MDNVIIAFFISALLIPIALAIFAVIDYRRKTDSLEVIIKLAISTALYLVINLVVFIIGLVSVFVHDGGGFDRFETKDLLIPYLILFGYICFGLLLCWFVNRDLVNTLRKITGNNKELQSILTAER
jgi:ABC-type Fe3+-siderophore transport system permease subunit